MKDLSQKELVVALGREGAPEMMGPRMEQLCFNPDALLVPSLYHTLSILDYEVTLGGNACPTFFLFHLPRIPWISWGWSQQVAPEQGPQEAILKELSRHEPRNQQAISMELSSDESCCSTGNNQADEQAGITQVRWQL